MSKNNKSVKVNFIMNAILNLSAVILSTDYIPVCIANSDTDRNRAGFLCCGAGDIFRNGCTAWYPYLRYPCMCDRQG